MLIYIKKGAKIYDIKAFIKNYEEMYVNWNCSKLDNKSI